MYLVIDPSEARRWLLRTVVRGKRTDMGLGGLKFTSPEQARIQAAHFRKIARDCGDPLAERRAAKRVSPTFEKAARQVYESHKDSWRNEKHAKQWIATLEHYVFPFFGKKEAGSSPIFPSPTRLRSCGRPTPRLPVGRAL